MKILFIVPYPAEGASNRFRIQQFIPYLEAEGLECRLRPFYSKALWRILYEPGHYFRKLFFGVFCALNRMLDLFRALGCEIVFIHRESFPIGPAWFERLLRWMGKKYIYDFDDAIFLPNVAEPNKLFAWLKCPGKVASIIRGSRITIAGNRYLAEFAEKCGAKKIEILPTVVDTGLFVPGSKTREKDKVVIGWIGSATTIEFVEDFRPVLERVLQLCDDRVCIRIVGGRLSDPLPRGISCVAWSLETELAELQSFDIGIMPMPDNEWTRGKCAFKAIEYMAVGTPAVCSPVGMNRELIQDGVNGFLCEDEKSWVEILCRLVEDKTLRERIGRQGRKLVQQRYSVTAVAPRFKKVIREAAGCENNS